MKHYFGLQYRMFSRQLTDFGLNPVAGYLILFSGFTGLSVLLFLKTEFAVYIYFFSAISLILRFSDKRRNMFLETCYKSSDYYTIRIAENVLGVLPFVIFLGIKSAFPASALLLICSVCVVFIKYGGTISFSIPTPFYKRPFEFIVGFRNSFYFVFVSYFLTLMAVLAGNFNLGIFALILILFISITYYLNPENEFFVWIFSIGPKGFLFHKIKIALLFSSILSFPVIGVLSVFFPGNTGVILGFQLLGYLYLTAVVLAKYSAFPANINLPQLILLAVSISFPPLLLGLVPYFYFKSIARLNELLS